MDIDVTVTLIVTWCKRLAGRQPPDEIGPALRKLGSTATGTLVSAKVYLVYLC